jgi:gamma-glutamyltranspeptidase/glutathione hydrolase
MSTTEQTRANDIMGKAEDVKFQYFPSRRSVVYSTNGIVSCTEPLACEAGVRILKQGGNAAVSSIQTTYIKPISTKYS